MTWKCRAAFAVVCFAGASGGSWAQEPPAADTGATGTTIVLTLKRSIDLALQNSKDIQLAKIQARVADNAANLTKSAFLPNLYAGSGAGYTYGLPETPGGRPPSIFSLTYTEEVFNGPLRGLAKEQAEQARSQRLLLDDTRNLVIDRVATSYLELVKVNTRWSYCAKKRTARKRLWG